MGTLLKSSYRKYKGLFPLFHIVLLSQVNSSFHALAALWEFPNNNSVDAVLISVTSVTNGCVRKLIVCMKVFKF
jgi:hypothetical protein